MLQRTRHATTRNLLWSLAIFCVVVSPLAAQVKPLNLQQMVDAAGTILIGTVSDVRGGTDKLGNTVTYTTFTIEQVMRGGGSGSITVTQYGGEVNGHGMYVAHARYFGRGERVAVMFYPASTLGYTSPVGLSAAVWTVTSDGKIQLKSEDLRGLSSAFLSKYNLTNNQTISSATFVAVVTDLMAQKKSSGKIPTKAKRSGGRSN